MSVTDGLGKAAPTSFVDGAVLALDLLGEITLTADPTVLTRGYRQVLKIDPDGAKDIRLPPEEHGLWFFIQNTAGGAETITVTDDADTGTVVAIAQNKGALIWCDGTDWHAITVATA